MNARRTISRGAAALLREIAQREGVSERAYLEALLHYAGSCVRRPGSWEAARPFEIGTYLDDQSGADRWFDADRQYAFPSAPPPCIGSDPLCPCQDGDACHYRDTPGSAAMPVPSAGTGDNS